MDKKPDVAMEYVHQGVAEAKHGNNALWQGYFLQSGGIILDLSNKLDSSLYYFNETIAVAKTINDTIMEANALGNIGAAYHARGLLQPALDYHLAAARLRMNLPNKMYLGKSYNNIGLLYRIKKDYAKALDYLNRSLKIKEEVGDSLGLVATYLNIGSCYQYLKKYDSALHYAGQTLEMATKLKDVTKITAATGNMGVALLGLGEEEKAVVHLEKALSMLPASGHDEEFFSIYQGLGRYHRLKGETDKAIAFVNMGLEKAREMQRREQVMQFHIQLAGIYAGREDYQQAFNQYKTADALKDSLLNEENIRQLNELNVLFETEQKEQQIELLQNNVIEKEVTMLKNSKIRNLLLLTIFFLLSIAIVIGFSLNQNRKKNKQLAAQKTIIEKQLKEKEVLMHEIHHRVKNNLQIISGLLNLQSRHIDDPNALQAVREGRNRVKSIALIHQQLYQQENITDINLKTYIHELMQSIQQSFRDSGKQIQYHIECPDILLDVEVAVPIGLIVNELITNSYKYAFTEREDGAIGIKAEKMGVGMRLNIFDNGVGLPPGFKWKNQKSFGMKMIATLIQKLNASMKIESHNGTFIVIYIPDYKNIS